MAGLSADRRVEFLRLLDEGVSVRPAAGRLGLSLERAYAWAREVGRVGKRTVVTEQVRQLVFESFAATGTVKGAALGAGLSFAPARRVLVAAGLVSAERKPMKPASEWVRGGAAGRAELMAAQRYTRGMTATTMPAGARLLCSQDRLMIADGLRVGWSMRRIAEQLNREPSTITREVAKHSQAGIYLPHLADEAAAQARSRSKPSKLATHPALRAQVQDGLRRKLSPEQISHRLPVDFPDDESMRVSTETIYQALYFQARGGLKKEVAAALRTGRTRRKPQTDPQQRRQRFSDPMVMISDRPAEVEDRAVPGHWEGDLIMGEGNRSAIGTLVERATRYTMLLHLPNGHAADQVRDALVATTQTLPAHLRGSLTWDQGSEMARHLHFTIATDIDVFFCDPGSPWQRGTNENTNGLLRQYFAKGTDLNAFSAEDLEYVAQELNGRPRKTLDWATPAERLRDLLTT